MLLNGRTFTTFASLFFRGSMKSSELHRLIRKHGWELIRSEGSHYIYSKGGRTYPVPFHGAKEVGKGIEKKIKKEMGLQ